MQHATRFLAITEKLAAEVGHCSVAEVQAWLTANPESFALIDVREASEWNQGHLPRALHLSKGVIERDIEKAVPDLSTKIVLYCGGGYRSVLAAYNLQLMGYTNVVSMDGGFRAWLEAKAEVVTTS